MSTRKSSKEKGGGANYDVGYGRPPKDKRFKPGQSGNPRGRPKKTLAFREALLREANRLVRVGTSAGPIRITVMEAVLRRLFQSAAEGDKHAARLAVSLAQTLLGDAPGAGENEELEAAIPDDEAVVRMMRRFSHLAPKDADHDDAC